MKITTITQPNAKGQIVIPKKIRDFLGIDRNSFLKLVTSENALHVYPVDRVETGGTINREMYLKFLKQNRGRWGSATKEELKREKKLREADLKAVEEARKAW